MKAPAKFKIGDRVVYLGWKDHKWFGKVVTITGGFEYVKGKFAYKLKEIPDGVVEQLLEFEYVYYSPLYQALT